MLWFKKKQPESLGSGNLTKSDQELGSARGAEIRSLSAQLRDLEHQEKKLEIMRRIQEKKDDLRLMREEQEIDMAERRRDIEGDDEEDPEELSGDPIENALAAVVLQKLGISGQQVQVQTPNNPNSVAEHTGPSEPSFETTKMRKVAEVVNNLTDDQFNKFMTVISKL